MYEPHIGGGAEITIRQQVIALRDNGISVSVLATGPQPGLRVEEIDGIRVWRAGIRNLFFHHGDTKAGRWKKAFWHLVDAYNPWMKSYVKRVLDLEHPDLVSCHNLPGWSVSVWDVLAREGIPVVQVLHDQYLLCFRSSMFKAGRACQRQCLSCSLLRVAHARKSARIPAVVGVSHFMLKNFLDRGYFRNAGIKEVIYSTRRMSSAVPSVPVRQSGGVVFGFIGTLSPHKGIERLLEAFLRGAGSNWSIRIAGTGKANFESELKERFSHPGIQFLGHVQQETFFPNVDITVVPSIWEEPLGMVVAESLIFGVPVLGAKKGGIPELIQSGVTGELLEDLTVEGIASDMRKMADQIDRWRQRKEEIRRYALRFSDISHWTGAWKSVYTRLLDQDDLESGIRPSK